MILKDPAVESLSSFIGVDGTNTTLNSGRIQINLKPLTSATIERQRRHPPAAAAAGRGRGHHAVHAAGAGPDGRGPRQPHAVPVQPGGRGRRGAGRRGRRSSSRSCSAAASCATWPATSRTRACRPRWSSTATPPSRLGITPQMIDDTLYDAFGQRQVSTMFTQLNQYRVVLEVEARVPAASPRRARSDIYLRVAPTRRPGRRCSAVHARFEPRRPRRWRSTTRDSSRPSRSRSTSRPAPRSARRSQAIDDAERRARAAGQHPGRASRARPQAFQASLANEPLLILAALVTVYIVLGVLYESYIHPITILSTLPSAGVGALLALLSAAPSSA